MSKPENGVIFYDAGGNPLVALSSFDSNVIDADILDNELSQDIIKVLRSKGVIVDNTATDYVTISTSDDELVSFLDEEDDEFNDDYEETLVVFDEDEDDPWA